MQTRLKGYTFTLSEPFREGTVITKGEAQALNGLRTENLANNLRKLVNEAIAELAEGEQISEARLGEIQAKISLADQNYQFLERSSLRLKVGDIEQEARAIAQERVEAAYRAREEELDDEFERLVALQEQLPAVREEARERVAARRSALAESLSDL